MSDVDELLGTGPSTPPAPPAPPAYQAPPVAPAPAASAPVYQAAPPAYQPAPAAPAAHMLATRYNDAYFVAKAIVGLGKAVQIVGYILAGITVLISFGLADYEEALVLVGFAGAGVVAFTAFVMGVLISAQGQMLRAAVDTAVNSSPLLTPEEVSQVIRQH